MYLADIKPILILRAHQCFGNVDDIKGGLAVIRLTPRMAYLSIQASSRVDRRMIV
jgi:hypothetical protein